jgi:hypothetical protein
MPDTPTDTHRPPHQRTYEATPSNVEVRQNDDNGVFELRMPIASTGDVRNKDDPPLSRDVVDGMAQQINDDGLSVGVFVDHGDTTISGRSPYSIAERVGEWQNADITTRENGDEADLLEATARMMDPDSLPDIPVRGHLGTVKELAQRDMAVPASIGWRDDDDAPGGVDLMEASVVGIQADKRTHSEAQAKAGAVVARAATRAGVNADALLREVKAAIDTETAMTDDTSESADDTDQDEQADDHRADLDETMERLVDLQEEQMEMLRELMGAMDDDDGDDDEEEDDEENAADDPGEDTTEQSDDDNDDERAADDITSELQDLRDELDAVRKGGISADDVDVPNNNEEKRDSDDEQTDDPGTGDAVKSLIK